MVMKTMGTVHSTTREERLKAFEAQDEIGRLFGMDFTAGRGETSLLGLPKTASHEAPNSAVSNRSNSSRLAHKFLEAACQSTKHCDTDDGDSPPPRRTSGEYPTFPRLSELRSLHHHHFHPLKLGVRNHFDNDDSSSSHSTTTKTSSSRASIKQQQQQQHRSDDFAGEQEQQQQHLHHGCGTMEKRDSTTTTRIPVGGRRSGRQQIATSTMTTTADSLDDDGEDYLLDNIKEDDDLKQFYDMQTWEMYLRITEARRKRSPPLESIAQAASITGTAFSAVPDFPRQQQQELQQGCYFVPSSYNYPHQGHHFVDDDDDDDASSVHSSDHEMVFGDLED